MIQNVDFKGIVRGTSAQNNADGNCEEIINLRKKMGAWRVAGEKRKIVENVGYEQVFLHEYDSVKNYIGIKREQEVIQDPTGAPSVVIKNKVIWFDPVTGKEKVIIEDATGEIVLNQLNNILLIKNDVTIIKAVFDQGNYKVAVTTIPETPRVSLSSKVQRISKSETLSFSIAHASHVRCGRDIYNEENTDEKDQIEGNNALLDNNGWPAFTFQYKDVGIKDFAEAVRGLFNMRINSEKGYVYGYVFVSVAYELYDGSITKPTPPTLIQLGSDYDRDIFHVSDIGGTGDTHIVNGYILPLELAKLDVKLEDLPNKDKYKDIIRGVKVYATKPIDIYDWENIDARYFHYTKNNIRFNLVADKDNKEGLPKKVLKPGDIDNLLFYEVGEYKLGTDESTKITVDFENITTNQTMPVDASGWINMTGDMFVYNNRLHLYNTKQSLLRNENMLVEGLIKNREGVTRVSATYLVYLSNSLQDVKIAVRGSIYKTDDGFLYPDFVFFPDSRAYAADVYFALNGKKYKCAVYFKSSGSYNFSYHVGERKKLKVEEIEEINYSEDTCFVSNNKIIVSERSNPYFFPVENSYLVDGNIINIAVSSEQISSSQIGQFPLYVFTTQGIYAIEVGDGNVLYSNIIPISAEVAVAGSSVLQTRYGIVFVTKTGLKLIAGREVVDISQAIAGNPDISMQECETFGRVSEVVRGYDIRPYFSSVPFQDYIKEASLGYDINENEIIVSNPNYSYSYVYNLDEKTWHKITEVFTFFDKHLALRKGEGNLDLCDIREEISSDRLVHLQTRPLLFNTAAFKQIYHAVARGEFKPAENRIHLAYMLASNDLSKWICMAVRKTEINAPHISLPRAHQSFRYFSFIVGGYVRSGHLLTHAELEGEVKYGNRLR